ncbi:MULTISPECIES: PRC-barrel domain-containing protein [unclassified Methanosarcina]|uniref:PRC-barrel domain-containing protein n=1 Tax=unclassified Methanosarcina TaxID=2644672 RepID=UPI00064E629A|nr:MULTISPECIES: PRC-barrel domain-containing protein [unclassified Methanosarcina]
MASKDDLQFLSASTIKRDRILNRAREHFGKIEELMIDLQDGRIAYAVLSFGGFLGISNKLFALPWKALSLNVHEHAFVLNVDKEVLEQAEGFDKDKWPFTDREWLSKMYTYYEYEPYWQPEMAGQTGVRAERAAEGKEYPDFLSSGTIKGDKVINKAGEHLGKIEELMIDLENGRVAYTVLSFGGFLGMGDKLFAIPWQALQLKVHEHAFVLDVPKETLKKAEGFDKDNWPITTREWLSTMYGYYGYQPYWQWERERIESRPGNI